MAKLGINTGSSPNDGTGDSLLEGAIKINSNFDEIYSALGDGSTITNSINYAAVSGVSTLSDTASYAIISGVSTYAQVAGLTTYAQNAGISTYANTAGIATNALFAGGLSGTPNLNVGIITATRFVGEGSRITGIITTILAGSNVSVAETNGVVTINSTAQEAISTQWTTVNSGIVTSSNVGVGTTVAGALLDVYDGTLRVRGPNGLVSLADGVRLNMGSGGQTDASIYYDAVDLRIDTSSSIRIGDGNNNVFSAVAGEGSLLYYNGVKKLQTLDTGVVVTGSMSVTGVSTAVGVLAGVVTAGNFYGDGSAITGIVTQIVAGPGVSISTSFGAVEFSVNTDSVWESSTLGISTTGNVGVGTTTLLGKFTVEGDSFFSDVATFTNGIELTSGNVSIPASSNIKIGFANIGSGSNRNIGIGDQALFNLSGGLGHNIAIGEFSLNSATNGQYNYAFGDRAGQNITSGSYNVILGSYNGNMNNLDIRTSSNNVVIADGLGNIKIYADSQGRVAIGTAAAKEKLTVAGIVSATSFYGTLNADQLTGVLPVLDGSNLYGITATGSGVEIRDNGSIVGTAATVDFGNNLNVSFAAGIATVSGASSVSEATTAYALAGTPNLNVGSVTATSLNSNNIGIGITTFNIQNGLIGIGTTGASLYDVEIWNKAILIDGSNIVGTGYLFYDNVEFNNFQTFSATVYQDLDVSGSVTSGIGFTGDGSGLTNLPAGQLTGALPPIDGSALLNVTASGTGLAIESFGINVGTATTLNFDNGLFVDFSAGIATITSLGGSGFTRLDVSGVTTSIPNNGIGNTDILGFKSYSLMKVGLSTAGWLRLYTDSTSRTNDANRSVGTDPTPGSGVIAEVVTTGISTTAIISPFVIGGNLDDPATDTIYAAITNLSGTTQSITATLTILPLEV